jgi:hypothetical protein
MNKLSEYRKNKIRKIEEIKERLRLTEDDFKNIKDKMKEYYSEYVKNNEELYNDYNLLKTKINKNNRLNKSVSSGPRNIVKFKQNIYNKELRKIIDFLLLQLENFTDFKSIMLFVAKRRQIIEILKLELDTHLLFGKFRGTAKINRSSYSSFKHSKASHLINKLTNKNQLKYNTVDLTKIIFHNINNNNNHEWMWQHTQGAKIINLLQEMNKIYEEFKRSLSNKNNKEPIQTEQSKNLLSKLYWLYMQTCPFERGSASIGEIIFSALLQKHFECDFRLFRERFDPHLIPDIHALTYPLEYFQSIFWDQFVSCENYKNNFSRNSNWNNYMNKRGPDF